MSELAKLKMQVATLKDLLETAYREVDKARDEADKADDEAIELKAKLNKLTYIGTTNELALIQKYKKRAERLPARPIS